MISTYPGKEEGRGRFERLGKKIISPFDEQRVRKYTYAYIQGVPLTLLNQLFGKGYVTHCTWTILFVRGLVMAPRRLTDPMLEPSLPMPCVRRQVIIESRLIG